MTDAFDADVLIYAVAAGHELGSRVFALFADDSAEPAGVGSLILLPEMLTKPVRAGDREQHGSLLDLLARLDLRPLDEAIANVSVELGARYRLRAADAVHLATAVHAGANRFITNNRRDFPTSITEVDVTYPEDLPDPV